LTARSCSSSSRFQERASRLTSVSGDPIFIPERTFLGLCVQIFRIWERILRPAGMAPLNGQDVSRGIHFEYSPIKMIGLVQRHLRPGRTTGFQSGKIIDFSLLLANVTVFIHYKRLKTIKPWDSWNHALLQLLQGSRSPPSSPSALESGSKTRLPSDKGTCFNFPKTVPVTAYPFKTVKARHPLEPWSLRQTG